MRGKTWTTYLTNEAGERVYNRVKINETATRYYANLYGRPERSENIITIKQKEADNDREPHFLVSEVN